MTSFGLSAPRATRKVGSQCLGPWLIIGTGVLLFLAGFGYWIYAEIVTHPGPVAVPDAVDGQKLTQKTVGPEAVADITRLHGKNFPLTAGAMGVYGQGQVTVWVSGAPASSLAAEMVRAMTAKIAEGRSPFTPLGARSIAGRMVYELTGMGQRHFYFQSGSRVVWLATDETLAENALQQVMTFYP